MARVAAVEADFLVLVAWAGAFFAAVLFVGAVFVAAFFPEAFFAVVFFAVVFFAVVFFAVVFFAVVFFAVAFFAVGRVVVFFEVVLAVSAMLLSIRASWRGRNREVEIDQLSSCQFATTAAIGGRTAATADITTAAVVE